MKDKMTFDEWYESDDSVAKMVRDAGFAQKELARYIWIKARDIGFDAAVSVLKS